MQVHFSPTNCSIRSSESCKTQSPRQPLEDAAQNERSRDETHSRLSHCGSSGCRSAHVCFVWDTRIGNACVCWREKDSQRLSHCCYQRASTNCRSPERYSFGQRLLFQEWLRKAVDGERNGRKRQVCFCPVMISKPTTIKLRVFYFGWTQTTIIQMKIKGNMFNTGIAYPTPANINVIPFAPAALPDRDLIPKEL